MQIYWLPIVIITLALIVGKVLVCSLSAFLAGRDGRTSLRVGMGLAQIGEFSFIIASLGISLKVMSPYLYPIIVAISAITTFLTPYLIKMADPLSVFLARIIPTRISRIFNTYTFWIQNRGITTNDKKTLIQLAIKKGLIQIFLNLMLIIAIFIFGSYLAHSNTIAILFKDHRIENTIIWGVSLTVSLPFLIAVYRKLKGLSMIIAEMTVKSNKSASIALRRTISEMIPLIAILAILLMITALSATILPPMGLLILVLIVVVLLTAILWRWFIKLHSHLQIKLMDTFKKKK